MHRRLFPELPPALFLDHLIPGLEGKLAYALGELGYMPAKGANIHSLRPSHLS